jgi:hypothetical protein
VLVSDSRQRCVKTQSSERKDNLEPQAAATQYRTESGSDRILALNEPYHDQLRSDRMLALNEPYHDQLRSDRVLALNEPYRDQLRSDRMLALS